VRAKRARGEQNSTNYRAFSIFSLAETRKKLRDSSFNSLPQSKIFVDNIIVQFSVWKRGKKMRINGRFMNFRYLFQLRKRFESKSELSLPNFRFRLYSSGNFPIWINLFSQNFVSFYLFLNNNFDNRSGTWNITGSVKYNGTKILCY
jgi:hypothetical protein